MLLGGAIFWAGPGVCPGTSEGGRGRGEMLKNWACASARKTESKKPTAKATLAPPVLVAAILISRSISQLKSRQIQAIPGVCHNGGGMLAHAPRQSSPRPRRIFGPRRILNDARRP